MSTIRWVVTRNGKRGHSCSLVSLGISIRKRNGRILARHCLYEVEPRESTGNTREATIANN